MDNIIKQGYLKKSNSHSQSRRLSVIFKREVKRWFVFGVREQRQPYLDYYDREESIFRDPPINSFKLTDCKQITYTLSDRNPISVFCVVFEDHYLELTAYTRTDMLDWCTKMENALRQLGIFGEVHSPVDDHIYVDPPFLQRKPVNDTNHALADLPPLPTEPDTPLTITSSDVNDYDDSFATVTSEEANAENSNLVQSSNGQLLPPAATELVCNNVCKSKSFESGNELNVLVNLIDMKSKSAEELSVDRESNFTLYDNSVDLSTCNGMSDMKSGEACLQSVTDSPALHLSESSVSKSSIFSLDSIQTEANNSSYDNTPTNNLMSMTSVSHHGENLSESDSLNINHTKHIPGIEETSSVITRSINENGTPLLDRKHALDGTLTSEDLTRISDSAVSISSTRKLGETDEITEIYRKPEKSRPLLKPIPSLAMRPQSLKPSSQNNNAMLGHQNNHDLDMYSTNLTPVVMSDLQNDVKIDDDDEIFSDTKTVRSALATFVTPVEQPKSLNDATNLCPKVVNLKGAEDVFGDYQAQKNIRLLLSHYDFEKGSSTSSLSGGTDSSGWTSSRTGGSSYSVSLEYKRSKSLSKEDWLEGLSDNDKSSKPNINSCILDRSNLEHLCSKNGLSFSRSEQNLSLCQKNNLPCNSNAQSTNRNDEENCVITADITNPEDNHSDNIQKGARGLRLPSQPAPRHMPDVTVLSPPVPLRTLQRSNTVIYRSNVAPPVPSRNIKSALVPLLVPQAAPPPLPARPSVTGLAVTPTTNITNSNLSLTYDTLHVSNVCISANNEAAIQGSNLNTSTPPPLPNRLRSASRPSSNSTKHNYTDSVVSPPCSSTTSSTTSPIESLPMGSLPYLSSGIISQFERDIFLSNDRSGKNVTEKITELFNSLCGYNEDISQAISQAMISKSIPGDIPVTTCASPTNSISTVTVPVAQNQRTPPVVRPLQFSPYDTAPSPRPNAPSPQSTVAQNQRTPPVVRPLQFSPYDTAPSPQPIAPSPQSTVAQNQRTPGVRPLQFSPYDTAPSPRPTAPSPQSTVNYDIPPARPAIPARRSPQDTSCVVPRPASMPLASFDASSSSTYDIDDASGTAEACGGDSDLLSPLSEPSTTPTEQHYPMRRSLSLMQQISGKSASHAVIPLKHTQVEILREQMSNSNGVILRLKKQDCLNTLALVNCFGAVWISGWNRNERPRLHDIFHIGDQVLSINRIVVKNAADAQRLIKNCVDDMVTFTVSRVPHGRVFSICREYQCQNMGIQRDAGTAEIVYVDPLGLAALQGLASKATTLDGNGTCNWVLTEINSRPLNLFYKQTEIECMLNAVGKDISFLVQPSDFIKELRKQLKKHKSYKNYLV